MGIESVRIRSASEDVSLSVALASPRGMGRVTLTITRDDGRESWAVVDIADLFVALQSLRANPPRDRL
jgi:hypothetical protein